jgi:hypothetical protein
MESSLFCWFSTFYTLLGTCHCFLHCCWLYNTCNLSVAMGLLFPVLLLWTIIIYLSVARGNHHFVHCRDFHFFIDCFPFTVVGHTMWWAFLLNSLLFEILHCILHRCYGLYLIVHTIDISYYISPFMNRIEKRNSHLFKTKFSSHGVHTFFKWNSHLINWIRTS